MANRKKEGNYFFITENNAYFAENMLHGIKCYFRIRSAFVE